MWYYYVIAGLTLAVAGLTAILAVAARRNRGRMDELLREQSVREYQAELEKAKAEINSLQSQINPHFLYNTLEVIRSEAMLNGDTDAAEMAEALANFFRYSISRKKEIVTLADELKNVENYVNIQKKRFGNRVSYRVCFESEKDEALSAVMPKLCLQPLVENAIYHGIEKKAEGGTVTIHVTVTEKRVIIQVSDNGPGMSPQTLADVERRIRTADTMHPRESGDRHGGIALANINRRIRMLYGDEYGLTLTSTENIGTQAELVIPLVLE